jgi:hypothetical protein
MNLSLVLRQGHIVRVCGICRRRAERRETVPIRNSFQSTAC